MIEREFDTRAVHQGYIEPHACVASVSEDGQGEVWCTTQGQYTVRGYCAKLLGMDVSKIRVTPSEIGGGFGGKTVVYLEPLALGLSRKACQPVKMTMSRTEVFRATGPTSGGNVWVRMGATRDGRITAAQAVLKYQAGAFGGSPVQPGCMCAFAPYDVANVDVVGYDVVTNRPKVAAYRAPGAPISGYAVEAVVDELAQATGVDPVDFRLKNAGPRGDPRRLWAEVRSGGARQDPGGGEGFRALPHPARAESGAGRRVRLLVQHRGRDQRGPQRR